MRRLSLILIIILPAMVFGQDLRHWFSEEFENLSESVIPESKIALVIGNTNYNDGTFQMVAYSGDWKFYDQVEMTITDAYKYASEIMIKNMMESDSKEGIKAFIEKRQPKWN